MDGLNFVEAQIHEFHYPRNGNFLYQLWKKIYMAMYFEPLECIIFVHSTKIGTHENKAIHNTGCPESNLTLLFFNNFLAHLSRRLKWAIVIVHRPSSVPLSIRPSIVVHKLSHFPFLLWNRWTEFNETWQDARCQHPLPSLCFSGRSEKQDGRPSLWLAETFSTSSLKPLNGIQRNLTGCKM